MKSQMKAYFRMDFFKELCLYAVESFNQEKTQLQTLTRNKKRMELKEDDIDGENHELKETKKSDLVYEN